MKDLLDFAILTLLYFLIFYRRWRKRSRATLLVNTTMYIYLAFVLYFTLMPILTSLPFIFNHSYVPMNLEPFIDVTLSRGDYIRQIILNIIMTIPFGFLLPLTSRYKISPSRGFLRTIFCTFLLSFCIEVIQPLLSSSRSSDITDVITNVLGGMIGYVAYLALLPLTTRVLRPLRENRIDLRDENRE